MEDYHFESDKFKELEEKWLEGNPVWKEFIPHRYSFKDINEVYNKTFLVTGGEFHFGFD